MMLDEMSENASSQWYAHASSQSAHPVHSSGLTLTLNRASLLSPATRQFYHQAGPAVSLPTPASNVRAPGFVTQGVRPRHE